ncbi:MAG: hypothetical protein WCG29_13160 [Desulfomonile sp.]|jgi:hypothetical protein|nr:hypothetical protein [Deltaproteobacteria bacterium]
MKLGLILTTAMIVSALCLCAAFAVEDPVKWSAPIDQYPSQWSPTSPPPAYYSPYGYQYDHPYGYGQYGGQWGYGGNYQGSQRPAQQGPYGNPYYYYGY